MIISRTPFRISFFGGGTDYPTWFSEHGGAVLSCTINRYCYITVRVLPPFFEKSTRIVWSKVENVNGADEIEHPVVRAALKELDIARGVEIHHQGDLPARSGIGSSSTFTVGLLHALHALKGRYRSKEQLAREAIRLEQDVLHENVGVQDQIAAAHGGINRIIIDRSGAFQVTPLAMMRERIEELRRHMLLFYTGISRQSSEIAGDTIKNIPGKTNDFAAMHEMVGPAAELLQGDGDLGDFGRLLHEAWMIKRALTDRVASPLIDEAYERARRAGALGGKLLGAGGGGFMMFFARPEDHSKITSALGDLLQVPVDFDFVGSQIIYYVPDA